VSEITDKRKEFYGGALKEILAEERARVEKSIRHADKKSYDQSVRLDTAYIALRDYYGWTKEEELQKLSPEQQALIRYMDDENIASLGTLDGQWYTVEEIRNSQELTKNLISANQLDKFLVIKRPSEQRPTRKQI
jgi:hypothetical protein